MARVIVQESLVSETSVIRVGLIEDILVAATTALDDERRQMLTSQTSPLVKQMRCQRLQKPAPAS